MDFLVNWCFSVKVFFFFFNHLPTRCAGNLTEDKLKLVFLFTRGFTFIVAKAIIHHSCPWAHTAADFPHSCTVVEHFGLLWELRGKKTDLKKTKNKDMRVAVVATHQASAPSNLHLLKHLSAVYFHLSQNHLTCFLQVSDQVKSRPRQMNVRKLSEAPQWDYLLGGNLKELVTVGGIWERRIPTQSYLSHTRRIASQESDSPPTPQTSPPPSLLLFLSQLHLSSYIPAALFFAGKPAEGREVELFSEINGNSARSKLPGTFCLLPVL